MGILSSVPLNKKSPAGIIAIIGRISSGKSTIAREISERYNIPVASFGGYLHHYSVINSLPTGRKDLQDLGEKLIKEEPHKFLNAVINSATNDSNFIILEGIRHRLIFDAVREVTVNRLSIFIQASDEIRLQRYLARNKDSDTNKPLQEFEVRNQHPVEQEVEDLRQYCDVTLNSETQSFSDLKPRIDSFMEGMD